MNAQEIYKHSLSGIKKVKITTDTSVQISLGSSNQLIINGSKSSKKSNEKAKGLKALYASGNDNTGQGFLRGKLQSTN